MNRLAANPALSRGREFALEGTGSRGPRSAFQRDRDRIIHSIAFRRLRHKTQVFIAPDGDHYRVRLTHSLEVAQIGRVIARALGLDEDLTEALCLAHDIGHPPFGHAGERALNRAMLEHGGFDHNAQALRIVTRLERHYADFDGLNLTWETLEGIAKHNGPVTGPNADAKHDGPLPEARLPTATPIQRGAWRTASSPAPSTGEAASASAQPTAWLSALAFSSRNDGWKAVSAVGMVQVAGSCRACAAADGHHPAPLISAAAGIS